MAAYRSNSGETEKAKGTKRAHIPARPNSPSEAADNFRAVISPAPPSYTMADAIAVTGVTRAQLEHLADIGVLAPSITRPGGKRRYYAFSELVALRALSELLATDVTAARQLVTAVSCVREEALVDSMFVSDGGGRFSLEPVHTIAELVERIPSLERSLSIQIVKANLIVEVLRRELAVRRMPAPDFAALHSGGGA